MEIATEPRDGRTVRAERTRQALVDALSSLLDEGRLTPTAAEVAERAGVSERSVFQHFPDRESLFEAVARQQYDRVMPTLERIDADLAFAERIARFTRHRARLYERTQGMLRAARLIEHESPAVAAGLTTARRAMAAEVERVFRRELDALPPERRDPLTAALGAVTAWPAWDGWRTQQRLGVGRARAAMGAAIEALLRPER